MTDDKPTLPEHALREAQRILDAEARRILEEQEDEHPTPKKDRREDARRA